MDRNALLNLLNLDDDPTPSGVAVDPVTVAGKEAPTGPVSPTALNLDAWGVRQGREVLSRNARMRTSELSPLEAADFFGAAFEPAPEVVENCDDPMRQQFCKTLFDTADYQALHAQTALNIMAAELAATAFGEQFSQLKKQQQQEQESRGGEPADEAATEKAVRRSVAGALKGAKEEVKAYEEMTAALGCGAAPIANGQVDSERMARAFQRVRNSNSLKKIMLLAGRFIRVAQSKQRLKTFHGVDDVVGITQDGEVSRLLPSELALLADEDMELDTLRRLIDRQALCRQFQGVEPTGKGPVIVTVDESGSMTGTPVETAKAVCLAMAYIAGRQRRWCGLVAYSGGTGHRILVIPPGRQDQLALLDWLEPFIGGGSNIDVPLAELPGYYRDELKAPVGKTDVLMITDAIVNCPQQMVDDFNAWKVQAQARVTTVVIGSEPGDLSQVSDEIHKVKAIEVDSESTGSVLSI